MVLPIRTPSELSGFFKSPAARDFLKEPRNDKTYEDSKTVTFSEAWSDESENDELFRKWLVEGDGDDGSVSNTGMKIQGIGMKKKVLFEEEKDDDDVYGDFEPEPTETSHSTASSHDTRVEKPILVNPETESRTSEHQHDEVLVSDKVLWEPEAEPKTTEAEITTSEHLRDSNGVDIHPTAAILVNPETESRTSEHLRDSNAAQERLDTLRGATDTRDHVALWSEERYCHRMFRRRAQADCPNGTCVEIWDEPETMADSRTFSQVHQGAETMAKWIAAACNTSTKDKVICIYLPRSYELIATVIGTWYAGAVVNVTDIKLPWQRLEYIVADASAALVITTEELVGDAPENMPCPILNVKAVIAGGTETNSSGPLWLNNADGVVISEVGRVSDENIDDNDCCVCIYTSGSTGNPKGVRLQYGAFSNYACIEQCLTLPSPKDRIVQTQSLSFIAGFHECWRGLASGATLILASSKVTGLGPDLEPWLRDREISIMKAVPSLLRSMMVGDRRPDLPKLRLFHVGGEAVTQDFVDIFAHGRMFLNTYGSTETCSNCAIGFCAPWEEHCTIGQALPSFKSYLLDKPESCEETSIGELYIGGMSLALDYLNLTEKTKEVFIQHPKFGRLYNTGDVVERLRGSGNLLYRGRRDNQTKINGYRVELGEVEAKMNIIDIVKEAAAVALDNTLYAFVSLQGSNMLTLEELQQKLTDLGLPYFALPSRLTIVEWFPKTISGKLDRNVLKQRILEQNEKSERARAKLDQGTMLGVLLATFSEVLRAEVQPTDDFFLLGGDSASAGQVVGLIRLKGEALGMPSISILDLYTHRTPQALNDYLCGDSTVEATVSDLFRAKRMTMQDTPRPRLFELISFLVALTLMFVDGIEVFLYFIIIWTSNFALPVTHESVVITPEFSEIFEVAWRLFVVKIIWYGIWMLLAIITKWTVIGRYREGRWAKYGLMHLRHWTVVRVSSHLPWRLIGGTGLTKWVMRAFGARVGKGTYAFFEPASGQPMSGYDLYDLEDFSSICQGAYCSPIYFTEDSMVCGRISLGRYSSLHPRSTVSGSVRLEEGAILSSLSNATDGSVLSAWTKWIGSPATPSEEVQIPVAPPELHHEKEFLITVAQIFDIFFGYYLVLCISMLPKYFLLLYLHNQGLRIISPETFIASVIMSVFFGCVALTSFSIIFVRAASFFCPSNPGSSHIYSFTTLLLWHKQWFARAAGMKLGPGSHISNLKGCIPDLVTIGEHTFLANPCFLGVPVVHNLMFHVGTVQIGDNVLVGNNACFPINTSVPSDTTIAVNTGPPPDGADPGGVWVGNPPVRITDANMVPFPRGTLCQRVLMYASEVLIIFIPGTLWAVTILTWLYLFMYLDLRLGASLDSPVWRTAFGAMLLVPLRSFWALFGGLLVRVIQSGFTRTPVEKNVGYWDSLCYRWRVYNKVWAFFIIPVLLDDFSGCMWMNRIVCLLTMAEIEKDALIVHHGLFKDHDYIKVRSGATINESCILRTHTFEDWRLKLGFVEIGPSTVVYPCSTVMFGSTTGENCTVVSNSLVLKGDKLANGTIIAGIPSVPVKNIEPDETDVTDSEEETESGESKKLLHEEKLSNPNGRLWVLLACFAIALLVVGVLLVVTVVTEKTIISEPREPVPPATSPPLELQPPIPTKLPMPVEPLLRSTTPTVFNTTYPPLETQSNVTNMPMPVESLLRSAKTSKRDANQDDPIISKHSTPASTLSTTTNPLLDAQANPTYVPWPVARSTKPLVKQRLNVFLRGTQSTVYR